MSIGFIDNSWTSAAESSTLVFDILAQELSKKYSPFDDHEHSGTQSFARVEGGDSFTQVVDTDTKAKEYDDVLIKYLDASISKRRSSALITTYGMNLKPSSNYSWAQRIDDILLNRDGEVPAVPPRALEIARRLAFYSDERARMHGVHVTPVISPTDDGRVQIEWNRRGKAIRHVECTISGGANTPISLLVTQETINGETLRVNEIVNATMHEVLAEVETLLKRRVA